MNYLQIEAFLTIIKTGSLNKAAELLYISQPSLTYRLKKLEDELGYTLFMRDRGQHITRLTADGKRFLPIAEQWKRAWIDTEDYKANRSLSEIRIASVDSLNTYAFDLLYRSLGEIADHLNIQTHHSYEIYNLVSNRDVDVGFVLQQLQFPGITITPLFSEKMQLVYSSNFLNCEKVHPLKLNPSNEVYLDWGYEFRTWHELWFGKGCQFYAKIDTISLMEQFLNYGKWAFVPSSVVSAFQQRMPYSSAVLEEPPPDRICFMITNQQNPLEKYSWSQGLFKALDAFLQGTDWLTRMWQPS